MDTNNPTQLEAMIEAILFYTGEETSLDKLAEILEVDEGSVQEALDTLKTSLEGRGIVLNTHNNRVALGTIPDAHKYIEAISTKELSGDLTQPLLETLTVILYESPIPKSQIDYIRGVNTTTALRHLMARGLIEKKQKASQNFYIPTQEALRLMGITATHELPQFEEIRERLGNIRDSFEESAKQT